jgi:Delta3-Delta2-enoyl-CoA isomerase
MIQTINHGTIRELRLNRPPVNALTADLIVALREAVDSAPNDGIRALVLSGTPGRFCAGLDVPLLMGLDRRTISALWRELYALMKALACSPIPICAAIIGHAPAGGTGLPLFCDWRIMADGEFKIGLNEVQVGIPLPAVILAALRRQVGPRQAERLATAGLLMSPAQALEIGLVDELVPTEHVVERAVAWCKNLIALPVEAMTATRHEARADLIAIFRRDLDAELKKVSASWWHPETQATLRAVVDRIKRK